MNSFSYVRATDGNTSAYERVCHRLIKLYRVHSLTWDGSFLHCMIWNFDWRVEIGSVKLSCSWILLLKRHRAGSLSFIQLRVLRWLIWIKVREWLRVRESTAHKNVDVCFLRGFWWKFTSNFFFASLMKTDNIRTNIWSWAQFTLTCQRSSRIMPLEFIFLLFTLLPGLLFCLRWTEIDQFFDLDLVLLLFSLVNIVEHLHHFLVWHFVLILLQI